MQYQMADALDVHWTTLSRWERGVAEPPLQQLWEVARLYLTTVTSSTSWAARSALPERFVRRAVIFCDADTSPSLDWYVQDALARGQRVNVLLDDSTGSPLAVQDVPRGPSAGRTASREHPVRNLPLDTVFKFSGGTVDVRSTVAAVTREESAAHEQGFSGVTWVGDFRAAIKRAEVQAGILSLEQLTDCLARGAGGSRGVVIYPTQCPSIRLMACLLCSHRWVVSPAGPVRNAFHQDPSLCLARLLTEAGGGRQPEERGSQARTPFATDGPGG